MKLGSEWGGHGTVCRRWLGRGGADVRKLFEYALFAVVADPVGDQCSVGIAPREIFSGWRAPCADNSHRLEFLLGDWTSGRNGNMNKKCDQLLISQNTYKSLFALTHSEINAIFLAFK